MSNQVSVLVNSRRCAEQAFQNYVVVVFVSLLALFPSMSLSESGFVTLSLTAVLGIWVLFGRVDLRSFT